MALAQCTKKLRAFGALLVWTGLVLTGSAPALVPMAQAQVVASPEALAVTVAPGGTAEVALTLENGSSGALALVVAPQPDEAGEGTPGETLFTRASDGNGTSSDFAMTPDGRLFVAEQGSSIRETWEYTPDLTLMRSFEHPRLDFFSYTPGVAWMPPEHTPDPAAFPDGTLWWLDVLTDNDDEVVYLTHAILVEGDLDGTPTGRQVEVPVGPAAPPWTSGLPSGLSYDPDAEGGAGDGTGLFYYVDVINNDVWAIGLDGTVAEGYPVPQTDYDTDEPFVMLGRTVDALRVEDESDTGDAGVYFETPVGVEPEDRMMRVALADRAGRSLGPETPLGALVPPDGFGDVLAVFGALRSRADPSVMYLTVLTGVAGTVNKWLYAVRAVPLPPRWLRAEPVFVDLAGGDGETVAVRLDAAGLAEGVYTARLLVQRRDGSGEALAEVPVTLTVSRSTDAEDGAEAVEATRLSVYPNPSRCASTVTLVLAEAADVAVAVYDVLGRRVAVLHEGRVEAGTSELRFDGSRLPAGPYLVRATVSGPSGGLNLSHRLTLVR